MSTSDARQRVGIIRGLTKGRTRRTAKAETPGRSPRSVIDWLRRKGNRKNKRVDIPVSLELFYEMAERSYLMRMVHSAIVREATRKTTRGLRRFWDFYPAFKLKCVKCGAEYQEDTEQCRCGSTSFREPDPAQLTVPLKLLMNPNPTATWGDITKRSLLDMLIASDWFVSLGFDYTGDYLLSLYHEDPRNIRICADDYGMLGNKEFFCPVCTRNHPAKFYPAPGRCPEFIDLAGKKQPCGHELVETCYIQIIDDKVTARFGQKEMMHGNGLTLGTRLVGSSPMRCLVTAIATHMAIDNYNYDAFSMQREPNSALIFTNTNQDEVDKTADDFAVRRSENPYHQLWLGLEEGQALNYVKMLDSVSSEKLIAEREWFRSVVCSVYGVSPIYVAVETPGRLGTTNDYQIHVQNNTTESVQDQFAEEVNRVLLPLLKVTDWYWDFVPVEPEDERLQADILNLKATAVKTLTDAGLIVSFERGEVIASGQTSRLEAQPFTMSMTAKNAPALMSKEQPEGAVRGKVKTQEEFYEELVADWESSVKSILSEIDGKMSRKDAEKVVAQKLAVLEQRFGRKAREFVEDAYMRGLEQSARDLGAKLQKAVAPDLIITFDARDEEALDFLMTRWTGVTTTLPEFVLEQKEAFSEILREAYEDTTKFNLRDIVARMEEHTLAERFKLERIARSDMTLISNNARANGYLKDPQGAKRKYDWNDASDACDACRAIAQGGPYDMETLRSLTNGFMVHPNDECTVTLHIEGLED